MRKTVIDVVELRDGLLQASIKRGPIRREGPDVVEVLVHAKRTPQGSWHFLRTRSIVDAIDFESSLEIGYAIHGIIAAIAKISPEVVTPHRFEIRETLQSV